MRYTWVGIVIVVLCAGCSLQSRKQESSVSYDLVITHAMILDGTGQKAYPGSVGIIGDEIAAIMPTSIEDTISYDSDKIIDAQNRILAPGFIDLHSHGNPSRTPSFNNFLSMGVTTICLGQDGSSPPTKRLDLYQDSLETKGFGVNIAMFIGHGTLRDLSGTGITEVPDSGMMQRMKSILTDNLPYAFGMTTGLEYAPGLYAQAAELDTLARITGAHNRLIMSHMRNEDNEALATSIRELLAQGAYCPVHISHLKAVYGHGTERAKEILSMLRQARARGIDITADVYPYIASYTGIAILFPDWSKTKEQFKSAKLERRTELENFIRDKVNRRNGPQATLFGTPPYAGRTLKQIADSLGMPFEKLLIDEIGPQGASAAYFVMDDSLQSVFIADSLLAIASDGSPTGYHPRGHGTFARLIEEYVNHRQVISLKEAIRKVTSYPAEILQLSDRGKIATGFKADLVLFYPDSVTENASFESPFRNATGFDWVMVNGRIARNPSGLSDSLAGTFLQP